jgi:hypothetical protein
VCNGRGGVYDGSEKLAYDINAVDSDQGREAFLAEVESFDKHRHEMPAFRAIWLLSLSDGLSSLRHRETASKAASA